MRKSNWTIAITRLAALSGAILFGLLPAALPGQSLSDQSSIGSSTGSSIGSSLGSSDSSSSTGNSRRTGSSRRSSTSTDTDSSSRRSSTKDTDSSSRAKKADDKTGAKAAPGTPGSPDRARAGQEKSTVVRRKAGKAGAGKGGGEGAPLPEIKILPGMKENALFFTPSQMTLKLGDQISTKLEFYNSETASVDAIDVWVKYDPAFLNPEWVDVEPLGAPVSQPADVTVWREQGYIRVKAAKLSAPLGQLMNPLAEIHWIALKPVTTTWVEVSAPKGEDIVMSAAGTNVLASALEEKRGRVSVALHINDPKAETKALKLDTYSAGAGDAADAQATPIEQRVRLAIVPASDMVATGAVSTADVVLINPNDLEFDTLRLRIRYDPKAVRVMDADAGNTILNGINIFDGDFHEQFPFDFHGANAVHPDLGVIEYWMGTNSTPRVYKSGTVARIVFRMLKQAGEASFILERAEPGSGAIGSDVSAGGRSLLGESDEAAAKVLHGTEIMVKPLDLRPQ